MLTPTQMRRLAFVCTVALAACSGSEPGQEDDALDEDEMPVDGEDDDDNGDSEDDDDDGEDDDDDGASPDAKVAARDSGAARDGGAGGRDATSASNRDAASDARSASAEGGSPGDASAPRPSDAGPMTAADAAPSAPGNDVPAGDHCAAAATWDMQAATLEQRVLELTNEARAAGHNCDSKGMFAAAPPLTMSPHLRCSSRLHSQYMATNREFDHRQAQTGLTFAQRIQMTGYPASPVGENIAWGQRTAEEVVAGWLESDGHCANMMNPSANELGVGYALGLPPMGQGGSSRQTAYWTQNFGRRR